METEREYQVVKGPEELERLLDNLLAQTKNDNHLKLKPYFILYEWGNQKSLLKVDLSEQPVVFWHDDLLGRPATSTVKEVIARFVWQNCGEKEWYFKELAVSEQAYTQRGLTMETAFLDWRQQIFEAKNHPYHRKGALITTPTFDDTPGDWRHPLFIDLSAADNRRFYGYGQSFFRQLSSLDSALSRLKATRRADLPVLGEEQPKSGF